MEEWKKHNANTCNNQPSSLLVLSNKSHFGVAFTELSLQTPTSEVEADFNAGDLISSLSINPFNWDPFLLIQLATLAQRLI